MKSNKLFEKEYYYGKSLDDNGNYDIIIHKEGGPFGEPIKYSRRNPEGVLDENYAFCQEDIDFDRLDDDEAKKWLELYVKERIDGK